MTVEIEFHYKDRGSETLVLTNGYHTRMVELGVYLAVGVMTSPGGNFWYSDRFKQPSAHTGMGFDTADDCKTIAKTLRTIVHALEEGAANNRAWVTTADREHLQSGTYRQFQEYLKGAKEMSFS